MKRYMRYKPTKYDWLPQVPAHWGMRTIRSITELSNERCGNRQEPLLSVYREYGVIKKSSRNDNHNVESEDLSGYKLVRIGDLVLNKMKMWQGSLGLSEYDGIVSPAYIVCHIIDDSINRRYLHILLRSTMFKTYYNQFSYGIRVGQWDMHYNDFKSLEVYLPPRDEQDQIARYLDWKVSKINKLIAAKKKQIALLEEHRASTLNTAVTQGISKNTTFKESRMKWLPLIPENWDTVPAKSLFSHKRELRHPDDEMMAATQKYGIISQKKYMELESRRIVLATNSLDKWLHVEPDDFIISLRSFQGGLERCSEVGCVTWHYVVLKPRSEVLPAFYRWFFKSSSYICALQQTSDFIRDGQDLRYSNFVKVRLCKIPMQEQAEIAEYLDRTMPKYDTAILAKNQEIDALHELRTRLVSDVVTGQIDVRHVDIPDFEYVEEASDEPYEEGEASPEDEPFDEGGDH